MINKLTQKLVAKLGYVPEKQLKDSQWAVKVKSDEINRLSSDLESNHKELGKSISNLASVRPYNEFGPHQGKYEIVIQINFFQLQEILHALQIKGGSNEYDQILHGLFYQIERDIGALLRLKGERVERW